MSSPAVSVVMPVFNGAAFLDRAIDSVRRQTLPDWELLAVDDGSTDASAERLAALAAAEPRLRLLRRPANGGPAAARNTALRAARAPVVAYLDCDDELYPDYLAQAHARAAHGDVLVFAYDLLDERPGASGAGRLTPWDPRGHYDRLFTECIVVPLGIAHRRDLLERAGLFDEGLSFEEDQDLWRRFARAGARFVFVPAKSGIYHVRPDSQARTRRPGPQATARGPGPAVLAEEPPWGRALLQHLGLRGLHCGCGPRLYPGWLNTDRNPLPGPPSGPSAAGRLLRVSAQCYYLQHDATRPFPLADGSLDWVYAEHFLEHLGPREGVAWLREVRRLLAPGGVARVSTPDLRRYVEGYLDEGGRFFAEHARRLRALGVGEVPGRRAWMVNQIFYGWGHRWLYDWEELCAAAQAAGFAPEAVREVAFRVGAVPQVAALDQARRADETLYAELFV